MAEVVEVWSEVDEEEGGLLVDGGEDELVADEVESGGSLVFGGGEEDWLLDDSTGGGSLRRFNEGGVVVAAEAVIAGEPSGAVLVDGGDEVPPTSGERILPNPLRLTWRWICWLWGGRGRCI